MSRFVTAVLSMFVLAAVSQAACPPDADDKPVRWIVPNKPGGGYDTYSRLIARFYEQAIGTDVYVDNVSGAGGLIGATALRDAKPDGATLGILNGPGLLSASLAGDEQAPNPLTDFTILARIVGSRQVWATAKDSGINSIEEVFREAEKRRIVFGFQDVGGVSFVNATIVSDILDLPCELVAGYEGSGSAVLAAMRGEVDIITYTFESVLDRIEAGDIKPLLQVTDERISSHASLDGVPVLGGLDGVAAQRAQRRGKDPARAVSAARAIAAFIGAGRLVAAPLNLDEPTQECMEKILYDIMSDPEFLAAAEEADRSIDLASGVQAREDLAALKDEALQFVPVLREALESVRK